MALLKSVSKSIVIGNVVGPLGRHSCVHVRRGELSKPVSNTSCIVCERASPQWLNTRRMYFIYDYE